MTGQGSHRRKLDKAAKLGVPAPMLNIVGIQESINQGLTWKPAPSTCDVPAPHHTGRVCECEVDEDGKHPPPHWFTHYGPVDPETGTQDMWPVPWLD